MHGLQAEKLGGLAMSNNTAIQEWLNCSEKKTNLEAMKDLERVRNQLIAENSASLEKPSSLVRVRCKRNKNRLNTKLTTTCWKKMGIVQQMLAIGAYLDTNNHYKAFTLRLSYEKMDRLAKEPKPADFLRRRIYAAYSKKFKNRVPVYGFILEKSRKGHLHLHGIIDLTDFPKRKSRDVLKQCAFGADFRKLSMHKYMLKIKEIFEGKGWLAYMAKNPELVKPYIYMANQIKNETKSFLKGIKK